MVAVLEEIAKVVPGRQIPRLSRVKEWYDNFSFWEWHNKYLVSDKPMATWEKCGAAILAVVLGYCALTVASEGLDYAVGNANEPSPKIKGISAKRTYNHDIYKFKLTNGEVLKREVPR